MEVLKQGRRPDCDSNDLPETPSGFIDDSIEPGKIIEENLVMVNVENKE